MLMDIALSWVRTLVAVGAGYLATKGLITHAQLPEVEGAVMVLIPLAFGAIDKAVAHRRTAVAVVQQAAATARGGGLTPG